MMVEQRSTCSPWRTPCQSRWRHLKEAVTRGKPTLEQAPGRTCGPVERGTYSRAGLLAGVVTPWGTHVGAVREELQPMGRTHIGEVHGGLSPVRGTPCWSRGTMRGVLPLRMKKRQKHREMN
ncbi:hypothetical protein GRJ2_001523600 [Grus japonensis]|uniref:Uncharacterized protein n=1 Tax=Grus japonensis TaxID=30415 RepID=A0ABC9WYR4_GRUJA